MKIFSKSTVIPLIFLIFTGILIRSLHFAQYINFSVDQALFATKALDIWRNKELVLIGPSISFHYMGREIYQGPLTYYLDLVFLLISRFDPVMATYVFMLFGVFMVVPLFYGIKMLLDKYSAYAAGIIYILTPLYINYTRSLWNPCFQFACTPLVLFLMGLHYRLKKNYVLFLVGMMGGLCLQFHYQYVLILGGIFVYYVFFNKQNWKGILLYCLGIGVGFSPVLLFELRNNFYNVKTALFFLHNLSSLNKSGVSETINVHYFVSISLMSLPLVLRLVKKYLNISTLIFLYSILFVIAIWIYLPTPKKAAGMAPDWNVLMEKKTYMLIRNAGVDDYNVVNLSYDTVATVQKYFMKRDTIKIDYDNYYTNRYLFVVSDKKDFMNTQTYEVSNFTPSKQVSSWKINHRYSLFLMERVSKEGSLTN